VTLPSRIPPQDLGAEAAILGAVLLEGRKALDLLAGTGLQGTDFYTESHRTMWAGMAALYQRDEPVDILTLSHWLKEQGELEAVGGPAALALVLEQAAIPAHLDGYARIVIEHGQRRAVIQTATGVLRQAYDGGTNAAELIGVASRRLEELTRRAIGEPYDPAVNWRHVVDSWQQGVIRVGLAPLDALTGGLGRGDLLVVAARTSRGKTALACDRLLAMATTGIAVDMLTLEETQDAMTRRLVANVAGVSMYRLRDGSCTPGEFLAAEDAVRTLQDLPLTIRGVTSLRALDEAAILGAVALSKADVVILDHIQKVQLQTRKGENYTYALRRLVDRLHGLAQRDRRVLWLNAQLSRETDDRKGPPLLSDILDSSGLENAARQVWLLHWPWKQAPDKHDPSTYEVYVAKNSEGGTGKVTLRFQAACGRFEEG